MNFPSVKELALAAKSAGASFEYGPKGKIVARNLSRLPLALRNAVKARLLDVLALVSEHSEPLQPFEPCWIAESAERIVHEARGRHLA